ncbi:Centromere protein O [Dorcoceras hygrometricum]|uniref:Centromere protein O n=1 Tax=Dorcoceras hygrometricum TaxID=472368 RepID=A0A2Z7ACA2_9LAMI|nr:Centromere protein O [Dorcoceras hygrometricum]
MEADRKALQLSGDGAAMPNLLVQEKITYKVGNKTICCLEGARIGIQYETSFAGEPCEMFHCILESKSFLEKMTVLEHTIPFFLPIREAENDFLSCNAMKFIDHVGELLQAYVDRREQILIGRCSVLMHVLFICKVTVSLRYTDLVSTLPSAVSVLAWPQHKTSSTGVAPIDRKENGSEGTQSIPARLPYAENALRSMSLPEGCTRFVTLDSSFPSLSVYLHFFLISYLTCETLYKLYVKL